MDETLFWTRDETTGTTLVILLHAMRGLAEKSYQTMRVVRNYKKKLIHLLIDSSSTNDFLNLTMAKGLGCQL